MRVPLPFSWSFAAWLALLPAQEPPRRATQRLPLASLMALRNALAAAGHHPRIDPAAPTHWMEMCTDEPGESFAGFARQHPRPLADELTAFYVAPLPPAPAAARAAAALAREGVAAATGLAAKELPLELPGPVPVTAAGQWNSAPLVSELLPAAIDAAARARGGPFADGVGFLATTSRDLGFEDRAAGERLNFVFGLSAERLPVVVLSTARLGDPTWPGLAGRLAGRRAALLAVHEFGHALGLAHCREFRCAMNGANDLEDVDGTPLAFCPDCLAKSWWRLGMSPMAHLQAMRDSMARSTLAREFAGELETLRRDLQVVETAMAAARTEPLRR